MDERTESLTKELEQRTTEELISILRNRDEEEWRPEVFEIVASVLKDRGILPDEVIAMGPEGVDVVESEPTVTIAHFFGPAEAHVSRMALEEAGIAAWVTDEAGGTIYSIGVGTRLQVREKDADRAREVLSAAPISAERLPSELAEPPCPACGSRKVALEAWFDEAEKGKQRSRTRRRWYNVCAECREAWPA